MMMQRTDIEYLKRVSDLIESGSKIRRRICTAWHPSDDPCKCDTKPINFCFECADTITERWDGYHTMIMIGDELVIIICCEGYHPLYDGTNDN